MHNDSVPMNNYDDASREPFSTAVFAITLILSISMCVLAVVGFEAHADSFLFGIALGLAFYALCRRVYGRRLFYKGRSWFARRGLSLMTIMLVLAFMFLSPRYLPGFQDWPRGPVALGVFLTLYSADGLFVRASTRNNN